MRIRDFAKKENFSDEEFEKIAEAIANWVEENLITPYELRFFQLEAATFVEKLLLYFFPS